MFHVKMALFTLWISLKKMLLIKKKAVVVGFREYEEGTGFVTNPTQYKLNELSTVNIIATQIFFVYLCKCGHLHGCVILIL